MMISKDVVIIGAGVTGSSIARELSKRQLDVLVVERASDVCEGTSKANSGIVHAGFDAKPGTLKAKLNVEGSRLMPQLSRELDFPYRRNGSLVLCFDEAEMSGIEALYEKAIANGVEGVKILKPKEVYEIEPNVTDNLAGALYAPTGAVVCPFNLTIAMAENAVQNGVSFMLNTSIESVKKTDEGYILTGTQQPSIGNDYAEAKAIEINAKVVVNAAGVHADTFHNMVSDKKIHITPRKGEYCLLDKKVGTYVNSTLFQLPTAKGKGILVTPTVHGNVLVGPTATDEEDRDKTDTTSEGLSKVLSVGALSVKNLPAKGNIITSFAGLRAHEDGGDFVLGEVLDAPGFVDAAGIESPGLSCAPAIGIYIAEIVDGILSPKRKENFVATRKGIKSMALSSDEERQELIKVNPLYANVVCRCELVTEGEIVDAINRPLGATTIDGVKRRTRAGMGRCQAGFCTPKQTAIIARELGVDESVITKRGVGSELLLGYAGDTIQEGQKHE